MQPTNNNNKVDIQYVLIIVLAVLFSWFFHELAHWLTGTLLGYDMGMTLNKVFPTNGSYTNAGHYQIVSAAGPLFTLVQAITTFIVMKRQRAKWLYPFLFVSLYSRLLATCLSFRHPNDEARISTYLGLGTFTLPLLMTVILFLGVYRISKQYQFNVKFNAINLGWTILFSSVIILTDQALHVRLL